VTLQTEQERGGRGHIFVSYSRRDLEWVQALVTELEAAGLPVWLDVHKLKPGVVWDSEIELALRGTDVLLVILSENSAASTNVLDEINFALSKNRLVVPVLHQTCEVPYRLARLQHIDFTGPREVALHRLVERLRAATTPGASGAFTAAAPAPTVNPPPVPVEKRASAPSRMPIIGAAAALLVLILGGFWWLQGRHETTVGQPTTADSAQAPAPIGAASPAASQPPASQSAESPSPAPRIAPSRPPEKPADVKGKSAAASTRSAEPPRAAPSRDTPPSPTPAAAAAPIEPAPKPTPAAVTPAPSSAATVRGAEPSAPPARPTPAARDEEAQIRNVIALYQRALNEKNLSLVEQTRPSLPRSEAQAILKGMEGPHTVSFADIAIKVSDKQASARLTRHDVLPNAPHLQTAVTITLLKVGDSWVIERIERTQ